MMETQKAKTLVEGFRSLPPIKKARPTLLEVAGYPHYENVCSNILSFFLDPEMPHGLKGLVVQSLLRAIGIEEEPVNIVVEREVYTDRGNRLDILVQSDSLLIGIENKIFAGLSNPLDDYANHLEKILVKPDQRIVKIVLSLSPIPPSEVKHGFVNLTYETFISELRSRLGFHVSEAEARYLMLLVDLMSSIENLKRGQPMDQRWLDFLLSHNEDIQGLLQQINNFRAELRGRVKELGAKIELRDSSIVKQWFYRESNELYDVLVHDIKAAEDLPIAIDITLSASGWRIQVFLRSGGNREKLKALLDSCDIEYDDNERFDYKQKFPFDASLELIQPHVQRLIDCLAKIDPSKSDV